MPTHPSPLRYPGGKSSIAPFLKELLLSNDLHDGRIVEPFAGGAGASLQLMFDEYVSEVTINDVDPRIFAFWRAVVNQTQQLVTRIREAEVTLESWKKCRAIYQSPPSSHNQLDLAFAVFFLNRCNRSGILMGGGPIGGYEQTGTWRLGARFNKAELIERIERVADYRDRISVTRQDARALLKDLSEQAGKTLVFLDPPYFEKGQRLYLNSLEAKDHIELSRILLDDPPFHWVLTYDNVAEIREMYKKLESYPFELNYSASKPRMGREVMFIDPRLNIPEHSLLCRP